MNLHRFKYQELFSGLYLTSMLACLVLFNRVTIIWDIPIVASSLVLPIVYAIADIITEIYGYEIMRRLTWITSGCLVIFSLFLETANSLPVDPAYKLDYEYRAVISPIFLVSILTVIALASEQFINSYFLTKWKIIVRGKYFWLRCVGSTAIGSLAGVFIGYTNRLYLLPLEEALKFIFSAYIYYLICAVILATPVTIVVSFLKKLEPKEALNLSQINFNPFKLRDEIT